MQRKTLRAATGFVWREPRPTRLGGKVAPGPETPCAPVRGRADEILPPLGAGFPGPARRSWPRGVRVRSRKGHRSLSPLLLNHSPGIADPELKPGELCSPTERSASLDVSWAVEIRRRDPTLPPPLCISSSSFPGEKRTREECFEHGEGAGPGAGPLCIPDADGSDPWPESRKLATTPLRALGCQKIFGESGNPLCFRGKKRVLCSLRKGCTRE